MSIFDEATHNILMKFLDNKSKEAEQEIARKGFLSEGHAIPLILKSQFNHIAHLDTELTTFREHVDRRFERLERNLFAGFAFLGTLITIYRFVH